MKISNIKNPQEFFQVLEKCQGHIALITDDGDKLNLKSKLCQYIVLMNIFNKAEIGSMEIYFSNPEDIELVIDYLIRS